VPGRLYASPGTFISGMRHGQTVFVRNEGADQSVILAALTLQQQGKIGLFAQTQAQPETAFDLVTQLVSRPQATALREIKHHVLDAQRDQGRRQQHQHRRKRQHEAQCGR
jgi:photosystem II stability/assembly factor-like uncharacterized protein